MLPHTLPLPSPANPPRSDQVSQYCPRERAGHKAQSKAHDAQALPRESHYASVVNQRHSHFDGGELVEFKMPLQMNRWDDLERGKQQRKRNEAKHPRAFWGKVIGLSHRVCSQPAYTDHGNDHYLLHSEYRTIIVPAGLVNLPYEACSKSRVAKSNEKAEDKGDDGEHAELRRRKKPSQEDRAQKVKSLDDSLSKPQREDTVNRLPGYCLRTPLLRTHPEPNLHRFSTGLPTRGLPFHGGSGQRSSVLAPARLLRGDARIVSVAVSAVVAVAFAAQIHVIQSHPQDARAPVIE